MVVRESEVKADKRRDSKNMGEVPLLGLFVYTLSHNSWDVLSLQGIITSICLQMLHGPALLYQAEQQRKVTGKGDLCLLEEGEVGMHPKLSVMVGLSWKII